MPLPVLAGLWCMFIAMDVCNYHATPTERGKPFPMAFWFVSMLTGLDLIAK
jgi:lipid-A-disaccharide synthase-like uncharacterized protein